MANHEHVLKVNVYEALCHVLHVQLLNESPHHPSYILLSPHFTDKKREAQGAEVTCSRLHTNKPWS